jgi:glutathione S-transferase
MNGTYRLWWNDNTGAFAVDAALALAGAAVQRERVATREGGSRSAEFLTLNPLGQVPLLRLPDGQTMTESAAMLLHVAESFPAARLAPPLGDKARPRFLRLLMILAAPVYEAELRNSYPARYTADAAGADGVRRAAVAFQDRLFALLATELGERPWLAGGDAPSVIDPQLAMLAKWYDGDAGRGAFRAHRARLRAIPVLDSLWRQYFPDAA